MAKPIKIWSGSEWVDVAINTPDISNHIADTTDVHGISNTANLVYTSDSRLTDSRTPTAHASSHGSAGSDAITIAQSQVTNLTTDLSAKAPLVSPTFTGTPAAPTAAAATNTTQIATTAFVRTEVSNLVASAPTALDTLDELAAALGDDANFATTITNSIAAKAPLSSPTFTGTVVLPSTTSIGDVSSTELGYLDGVTSSVQTQLNSKANLSGATFTGNIVINSGEPSLNYSFPSTDNTAQWVKLGTFGASQDGKILMLRIFSHNGYNAMLQQNQITELYFKTSNGASVDSNGFAGDAFYWTIGRNKSVPSKIKIVSNVAGAAATSWTIFAYCSSYTNSSFYSIQKSSGSTWTHGPAVGQTDPGNASSTVLIPSLHSPDISVMTNAQTGSYTLEYGDIGKLIEMNVASANNLTVPLNSSVEFPIGTKIDILQTGAGQTTIVATGGVTINANPGLKLSGQWAAASLIKRGTDTWALIGNISA